MGKIRVKSLGIEEIEKEQAKNAKKRKESKKMAKGAHGGERVVSMAPTEEELERLSVVGSSVETEKQKTDKQLSENRKQKTENRKARQRSKRYRDALIRVDKSKSYPLSDAISLLKQFDGAKFDPTVELHINTVEKGLSGQVTLPHGTGKALRVAIADPAHKGPSKDLDGPSKNFEELLRDIEAGKIEFDVLIATPSAMGQLAKVAKILGPRGLMPNPKSGTISDTPEALAEKFKKGATNFRTESQAPIIHTIVGKLSFSQKNLEENIAEFIRAVSASKIRSITLKSTMSPGIKLETSTLI